MSFFRAGKRGRLVGVLAAVAALGGGAAPALAGSGRPPGPVGVAVAARVEAHGGESVQIFYTPPVLVRLGEPVQIPVDAACITASGTVCAAHVTLAASAGSGGWTSASAPASAVLRFDASKPAARALAQDGASTGSVRFTISATSERGSTTTLGAAGHPLRFYVVRAMSTVHVPTVAFGRVARGRTVLYLPWGTGPASAGVSLGSESLTLGPPSFAVGSRGAISLLDGLHDRLAVFRLGRLTRTVPLGPVSADADVAAAPSGALFVSSSDGAGVDRSVTIRTIEPGSSVASPPAVIGRGVPERLTAAGERASIRLSPEDEWRSAPGDAPLTVGRPLVDGSQLLSVMRGRTLRLATVRDERVQGAVELSFSTDVGELALAEPDGHGGYVVVVHVATDQPKAADQYQVVHVEGGRIVSSFAVARRDFANAPPLSRFRLGPDGALYQLASSSDGIRIVRYQIGGVA